MLVRLRLITSHFLRVSRISTPIERTMSTFILPHSEPECPVQLAKGLSKDQLLSFRPFKDWISAVQKSLATQQSADHAFHASPYKLRKIDIQSVDFFGGSRIGFIKLKAEVSNDNGEKLPGAVFLRGGSVAMMVRTIRVCLVPRH